MTSVDLQGVCDPLLNVPAEYATIWRHLEACYYRTALQAEKPCQASCYVGRNLYVQSWLSF